MVNIYLGTGDNDAFYGGAGRDRAFGLGGDDLMYGIDGRDALKGGADDPLNDVTEISFADGGQVISVNGLLDLTDLLI